MLPGQPEVGATANSYAILAKLATGGMAEIFLARTVSAAGVERHVVLKRVLQHRATDITFVNMFLDEARLAAQLQHPNIAQVYDTGKLGDSYFFTMEYVHGETVRELLHRAYAVGQPVPIGCALTIVAGAAAGLHHAHERLGVDGQPLGIVHRDVSPSNLMVSYDGNVKVVDFGVAKATHRSIETQSGTVKGKIGYMSPEQCRGGVVDQRCDLFSLGIVMWELLVGDRLFRRATDFESMEAIVSEPAPPPSSRRADVARELDDIVARLLAKAPRDRFQSADQLCEAIEGFALQSGISLSVASLRRFIRELFGQRPEPWIDMRTRELEPEVVTVTGSPLATALPPAEQVDAQLDRLLDLSTRSTPSITVSEAPPAVRADTAPTTVSAPDLPRTPGLAAAAAASLSTLSQPSLGRRRRRRLAIAVGAAALAGLAVGAVLYARRDTTAQRAAGSAIAAREPEPAPAQLFDAGDRGASPVDAAHAAIRHGGDAPAAPARRPAARDDVLAAYRDGRFDAVVSACAGDARLAAAHAATCTLAACRERDAARARRWLARVPAGKQASLISSCRASGTPVEAVRSSEPARPSEPPARPPKRPDCDPNDPMACRR